MGNVYNEGKTHLKYRDLPTNTKVTIREHFVGGERGLED